MTRAKEGDKSAFAELVREHQSLVYSIAFHFLHATALAEEIAQDIFLDLYRNIGKIDSAAHLVSWLRRSTTNRCIDQSRKLAYRTEVPVHETFDPAAPVSGTDVLMNQSLKAEIAALPEWQKAVVILRYQEDLDPGEIADLLKMPVNTVKSRLHRALASLREGLERKQRVLQV